VTLLGGAVSRDKDFIARVPMKRAVKAIELMHLLPQFKDPQSELLLLRSCMGIAKLFFGLRTCQPIYMEEATILFDKELRGAVEDIVVCGGPFFRDLQWRLDSLQAAHAQDFLLAIPIDGLYQHMSPVEYRTILKYHLMIPLFPIDEVCPVCRKACLDNFGEHTVHCRELSGFKYRHDFVRDVLFYIFRHAGISIKSVFSV
jgi:hypothetical protein